MNVQHTPGPWSLIPQSNGSSMVVLVRETNQQMQPKAFRLIAHVLARGNSLAEDEANARRIVQCVNACTGIPEEVLATNQAGGLPWSVADQIEQRTMQRELIEAAQLFLTLNNACAGAKRLASAIAKATGSRE